MAELTRWAKDYTKERHTSDTASNGPASVLTSDRQNLKQYRLTVCPPAKCPVQRPFAALAFGAQESSYINIQGVEPETFGGLTNGTGMIKIARSTATSDTASAIRISNVFTHSALRAPSVWKLAEIDVPQAAIMAMKNVVAHAPTTPIRTQFAMSKARPLKMRR